MRCPRCRPTPIRRGSPRRRSSPSAAISAARPTPWRSPHSIASDRRAPAAAPTCAFGRWRTCWSPSSSAPPRCSTNCRRTAGITGIGLSDDASYAQPLARRFGYENTWFHTEPQLDIANVAPELAGRYDFLVASDVFEHVVPPVGRAFANARMLLKPGGAFVFSVPFSLADDTVEHFPELFDFRVAEEDGRWRLRNVTADGRAQVFDDLVFHGGPGTTLEMRLFSRAALLREFTAAGFASVRVAAEPYLPFGIVWPEPWSVPMVARA